MSEYTQKDYEAVEATIIESPRGRWFLNEFARRNRAADTLTLLEAIRRLERNLTPNPPDPVSTVSQASGSLTPENLSFFKGDEGLFEPMPEAAESARGRDGAASLAGVAEEQGRSTAKEDAKDRIVFIRRASSRETSIPLAEEADEPVTAARPQPGS